MNRLEFIGQTYNGINLTINDVIKYFDHSMAVYESIEGVDKAIVEGQTDEVHSSLKIKLDHLDPSEMEGLVTHINEELHNRKDIYGRKFQIDIIKKDSIIELCVQEDK